MFKATRELDLTLKVRNSGPRACCSNDPRKECARVRATQFGICFTRHAWPFIEYSSARRAWRVLSMCVLGLELWRRRAQSGLRPTEIARGIHIRRRADEIASVQNGDAIANIGFIVGRDSVAVLDSGVSNDGQRLRR